MYCVISFFLFTIIMHAEALHDIYSMMIYRIQHDLMYIT